MNRYRINEYPTALHIIEGTGRLWDLGQIHPAVLTQLHMAANRGMIRREIDGYPLGGPGGERLTVFKPSGEIRQSPH